MCNNDEEFSLRDGPVYSPAKKTSSIAGTKNSKTNQLAVGAKTHEPLLSVQATQSSLSSIFNQMGKKKGKLTEDDIATAIEELSETILTARLPGPRDWRRHNATANTQQSDADSPQPFEMSSPTFSSPIHVFEKASKIAEAFSNVEQKSEAARSTSSKEKIYSLYENFSMMDEKTHKMVDYTLDGKLGSGGFSKIFLVHNLESDDQFAMKTVNISMDEGLRPQFLYELEILKKFTGTEHIINLYNYQVNENELLMILELGSEAFIDFLCRYQRVRTEMEHAFLRRYFIQMVSAVHFIHKHEVVHCDIKADNYVLVNQTTLKLVDFGCATTLGNMNHGVFRKRRLGTKHYMPPEYMRENFASKSFDVWSLGCILYDMIHERTPFESETNLREAILNKDPDLTHVTDYPDLAFLFVGMFDRNPKERITCHGILKSDYIRSQQDDPASIPIPRKAKIPVKSSPAADKT